MSDTLKAAVVGGVAGAVVVLMVGVIGFLTLAQPLFAQSRNPPDGMTHEQMHQMMDAMHGPGTSDRMHEAMGADGEKMMDQCAGMMNMMGSMQGMMGGGGMQGTMGRGG